MWRFVLVLVYCGTLAASHGFKVRRPIKKCIVHKGPLPLGAEVDGCSNAPPPCELTVGESAVIPIAFRAPRYTTTLTTSITTYQTFQRIVYSMPQELNERHKTCNFLLEATCPVRQGEILLYPLEMPVPEPLFRPGEPGAVEIRIMDDRLEEVVCLRVEFVITAPRRQPYDPSDDISLRQKYLLLARLYNK